MPKTEDRIGAPLSPYAVTKYVNELYADVFARTYGLASVGLRYFNVFGPRQDPEGAYAAVIPRWIVALIEGRPVLVHGDGSTSRDFCYVANAVQANLLAACVEDEAAINQVYNVAVGDRTTLNELFALLRRKPERLIPEFARRRADPWRLPCGRCPALAGRHRQGCPTPRLSTEPPNRRRPGRSDALVLPSCPAPIERA